MPTVKEILRASGLSESQIDALDAKAMSGFTGILDTAEKSKLEAQTAAQKAEQDRQAAAAAQAQAEKDRQAAKAAQEKAEFDVRANREFYENEVVPGLTGWEAEKKALETKAANEAALAAFYKAQNDGARGAGFIPTDAPVFTPPAATPPRVGNGQYVANAPGSTPGSPTFMDPNQIAGKIGDVAGAITDIQWKYQALHGKPLPIAPSELIRQADALKLSPMDYASRTFNFVAREQELAEKAKQEHDAAVGAAAVAAKEVEWKEREAKLIADHAAKERLRAEQIGSNPDVRQAPGSSRFAEVARAVKEGTLPDPLKMTDAQRRAATRTQIHQEIAEREQSVA